MPFSCKCFANLTDSRSQAMISKFELFFEKLNIWIFRIDLLTTYETNLNIWYRHYSKNHKY